jgi:hypothetical protein
MMRKLILGSFMLMLFACGGSLPLRRAAKHYQQHQDTPSLQYVVDHLPAGADTTDLRRLLGPGIDMGFDWRYLLDSTSSEGCVVGAVFHINGEGQIDQQWLGDICE